ncbi:MAG: lipid-binding SYLF domain-containing protein [bacterium]|nr:lipid-binding SYLF domain-containing protein [bacterium]
MNKKIRTILALLLAIVSGYPLAAVAQDIFAENTTMRVSNEQKRARMGESIEVQERFRRSIDDATKAYGAIVKGEHGQVPDSVLRNARCIAIIPNVVTGALVVGGAHGTGLVSCRGASATWSQPATVSYNQGSIGLQAGAKSADLVVFFQTPEAVKALKSGKIALGTDASAVAGRYDSTSDTSSAGVIVYTRSEGFFAGASISGSEIVGESKELANYYGTKVDYAALLEGRENPDSSGYAKRLTSQLPDMMNIE